MINPRTAKFLKNKKTSTYPTRIGAVSHYSMISSSTAILLTARERWEHGYEFAVAGELIADQHALFDQLKAKTKQGLSKTYLKTGTFPSGELYTTVKGDYLKGVLSYSETNSESPLVIIDGKPYSWKEVGRLLQAFEGFQVKIEMKELVDEWDE